MALFSLSQDYFIKVLIWSSLTLSWQMTSGRGGFQLWKCLYLARNVTKGNNVLNQSTLMDLSTISAILPLTRETRETTANKAALPLVGLVPLTAVQHCWRPIRPTASGAHMLTSDLAIESYRLSASLISLIGCSACNVCRVHTKELHVKCTFYADNTAAELNVSSGRVWMLSLVLLWRHWL